MRKMIRLLHLNGIKRRISLFFVNKIYVGTRNFEKKRRLLNSIGFQIGDNTKIVGPIECTGKLIVGKNCWIGKNLKINGNGIVTIGDNCDIAPEVTFQTGGHEIGFSERRAGKGKTYNQNVGSGVWICGRSTIQGDVCIGDGAVVAGCACVTKDVPKNTMVGGVPAKIIRGLDNE